MSGSMRKLQIYVVRINGEVNENSIKLHNAWRVHASLRLLHYIYYPSYVEGYSIPQMVPGLIGITATVQFIQNTA